MRGALGSVPSRLFGRVTTTDWSTAFDGVLMIRDEVAPTFELGDDAKVIQTGISDEREGVGARARGSQPRRVRNAALEWRCGSWDEWR